MTELCVLRTFGGVDFSLVFIYAQSVSEFLWDRFRASIQFTVMPKRAQYARFSGEFVGFESIYINGYMNELGLLKFWSANIMRTG